MTPRTKIWLQKKRPKRKKLCKSTDFSHIMCNFVGNMVSAIVAGKEKRPHDDKKPEFNKVNTKIT